MSIHRPVVLASLLPLAVIGCGGDDDGSSSAETSPVAALVEQYATVRLTADLSTLADADREVLRHLIQAAESMDEVFWMQAYASEQDALALAGADDAMRRYIEINYGPWDRLRGDEPFVPGIAAKPLGANLYPAAMTDEEFEADAARNPELRSLYTLVRRDAAGVLTPVPYHVAFERQHAAAAAELRAAAGLTGDAELMRYLRLRADALETDEYRESDLAWMDMKDNQIDVIIGPIETYEDTRFGLKATHEAIVLIKDMEWSARLARFAELLPELQRGLPVPAAYKRETPGAESELNAYDVVYYAGEANAGAKAIAINLPNDEQVQLQKGTRRLQLKNVMQAKFDQILVPIANALIAEDQRRHVTFDAFFADAMFHEVAHGLGVKNTIDGRGTVREALRDYASPMEEGKADIVGLHMIERLLEQGEITDGALEDYFVTFLAGIFRSVRFGAADAHGRANMVRFHYFQEMGAFTHDAATGTYRVDFEAMSRAVEELSRLILTLQGDGDYAGVDALMTERGFVPPELAADLERLDTMGIPRDVVFEQGVEVLLGGR